MTQSPFAALANPTRRRILDVLADGEQSAGALLQAIAAERPISQPGMSQHLRALRAAGLVRVRHVGTQRHYSLDPTGLDDVHHWLMSLTERISPFDQQLDALATEVARGRRRPAARHRDHDIESA